MGFQCGIVGLPNVGKSTLFNALTSSVSAEAQNYPFCTIEPNVGVVTVPDHRMENISRFVNPEKEIPAVTRFVDIAGLVRGASKGEGLGNQFLAHIRETQAIVHVVRCYEDENVVHVEGQIDPVSDAQIIETELQLADLDVLEKAKEKALKQSKSGHKELKIRAEHCQYLMDAILEKGWLYAMELDEEIIKVAQSLHLISFKPMLYVANVPEDMSDVGHFVHALEQFAQKKQASVIPVCAKIESELSDLEAKEKSIFLQQMNMPEPGLNRVVRAGYDLLGLQTFFTAGKQEVRAWTVPKETLAPQAAGVIHGDFERSFIRAEVISYEDYVKHEGESGAKQAGLWRLEGKDYVVQDGDVIYFRVNT
tara:strand:+ start:313 stop:1407 length:1095 start_codon:yes stop_codon:yes gene_type:complete